MRLIIIATAIWALFFVLIAAAPFIHTLQNSQQPPPFVPITKLDEYEMWKLIQNHRKSLGLQPFIEDERLCKIAEERAKEITTEFSHDAFVRKIEGRYYTFIPRGSGIAENLLYTDVSEAWGFGLWLNSPTHRKYIEGSWKYSCLRCSGIYCQQTFSSFDGKDHSAPPTTSEAKFLRGVLCCRV